MDLMTDGTKRFPASLTTFAAPGSFPITCTLAADSDKKGLSGFEWF